MAASYKSSTGRSYYCLETRYTFCKLDKTISKLIIKDQLYLHKIVLYDLVQYD